jgi:hypothetical protein
VHWHGRIQAEHVGVVRERDFIGKGERDYRWGLCRWNGGAVFGKTMGRILFCVVFMLILTWKWGENPCHFLSSMAFETDYREGLIHLC